MEQWLISFLREHYADENWKGKQSDEKYSSVINLADSFPKSKISFDGYAGSEQYPNDVRLGFFGGVNGSGDWRDYLYDITELIKALFNIYDDVWVIDLYNDCIDDVWYLVIGARNN